LQNIGDIMAKNELSDDSKSTKLTDHIEETVSDEEKIEITPAVGIKFTFEKKVFKNLTCYFIFRKVKKNRV